MTATIFALAAAAATPVQNVDMRAYEQCVLAGLDRPAMFDSKPSVQEIVGFAFAGCSKEREAMVEKTNNERGLADLTDVYVMTSVMKKLRQMGMIK